VLHSITAKTQLKEDILNKRKYFYKIIFLIKEAALRSYISQGESDEV